MTTSNIRLTGDTSNLTNALDQVENAVERTKGKFNDLSDSIRNVPNPNIDSAYNNQAVENALNNQAAQTQIIQQQISNAQGGAGGFSGSGTTLPGTSVSSSGGAGGGFGKILSGGLSGGMTKALAAAGPVGLGIAALLATGKVVGSLEKKWEDKIPNILDTFNSLEDTTGTAEENSKAIRGMYSEVNRRRNADDVRFNTNDYLSTMRQLKEYGISGWEDSLNSASTVLKFENAGIGSRSQLLELEGMSRRFGQDNALNNAYAGLTASGMEKGQFDEFLSSMESIFEDGISKGIVKGYDEISADLTLLETLSGGNKLWQGQYGAQNLQQINSSVEGATKLGSVNDVLMYQAIDELSEDQKKKILGDKYSKDNGYINNMMILEKGLTTDTMGVIFKALQDTGGSRQDQIERFMRAFGFNYTKAAEVYDIAQNYSDEKAQDVVKTIGNGKANVSADSIDRQVLEARENMSNKVADIGNDVTKMTNELMKISEKVLGITDEKSETQEIKMSPVSEEEVDVWNELVSSYSGPLSPEVFNQTVNDYFNDESKRNWADTLNFQNLPGLAEAWNSRDGTKFFTNLFNPELFDSTGFGPMPKGMLPELMKDKDFKKTIGKSPDFEKNSEKIAEYYAVKSQFDPTFDPTMQDMLSALKEMAAFFRTGSFH
ncbi:MAG: hypothetical protein MJZ37_01195 [Bacilli bacterium]|nr:hypothetical protein [Bacilli bacterium]